MRTGGWVTLLVLLILSVIVNVCVIYFLLSKLHVFRTLRKAVYATFGDASSDCDVLDIPLGPEPPAFTLQYSSDLARYGSALLWRFACEGALHQALDYLVFAGSRFGAVVLTNGVLFLLLRGTQRQAELSADLRFQQREHVHSGFLDVFRAIWPGAERVMHELAGQVEGIVVVGHSLGAAVATLLTRAIAETHPEQCVGYGFGSPRVGDLVFAKAYAAPWFNVINEDDIITDLPLSVMPNPREPSQPLLYQHVGEEIRFRVNQGSWFRNHSLALYHSLLP